ncbi:hypothetical protein LPJ66_011026, partial [Kickxella alabastrina]
PELPISEPVAGRAVKRSQALGEAGSEEAHHHPDGREVLPIYDQSPSPPGRASRLRPGIFYEQSEVTAGDTGLDVFVTQPEDME